MKDSRNVVGWLLLGLTVRIVIVAMVPTGQSFAVAFSANTSTSTSASTVPTSSSTHVAVVGCGVLGTRLCKQLLSTPSLENWKVTGITKTRKNHESIQQQILLQDGDNHDASPSLISHRFSLTTMEEILQQPGHPTFDKVVFCAPPSGFEDYAAGVQECIENLWNGYSGGGSGSSSSTSSGDSGTGGGTTFVFTSSGGIYGPGNMDGTIATVNENSALPDPSASSSGRLERLIRAERTVLQHGGTCLRLAGLYSLERGAHNYWLTRGTKVRGRADGIINLLHYDDAAGAVLAALMAEPSIVNGKVFLISDGTPMTRQEICQSSIKARKYHGMTIPKFLGDDKDKEPIGKVYDGSHSNKVLKWSPRYKSFDSFMSSHS